MFYFFKYYLLATLFSLNIVYADTISYFPGENKLGALLFEDNFPCQGDWDFNDLIVRYNVVVTGTNSGEISKITWHHSITAVGASYDNGFSVELPVVVNSLDDFIVTDSSDSVIVCTSLDKTCNGIISPNELSGVSHPLIIRFFTREKSVTDRTSYLNTFPNSSSLSKPIELITSITFSPPVSLMSQNDFCSAKSQDSDCKFVTTPPYNPFLTVDGNIHKEVHLSGYTATRFYNRGFDNNCNHAGIGCGDLSKFNNYYNNGECFKNQNGLPWALELGSTSFNSTGAWPKEKIDISEVFIGSGQRHSFIEWANSGGADCADGDLCKWWEAATASTIKISDLGNDFLLNRGDQNTSPHLSCKRVDDFNNYYITKNYTSYANHGLKKSNHHFSKTLQADWNTITELSNTNILKLCELLDGKTNSYWVLKNGDTNYSSTRPYYIKSNETSASAGIHGYVIQYTDGTRTTGSSDTSWASLESVLGGCIEVDGNCTFENVSCYVLLESWEGNRRALGHWP